MAVDLADEGLVALEGAVEHHDLVALYDARAQLHHLLEWFHERGQPGDLFGTEGDDALVALAQKPGERRNPAQGLGDVQDVLGCDEQVSRKEPLGRADPHAVNAAQQLPSRDEALRYELGHGSLDQVLGVGLPAASDLNDIQRHGAASVRTALLGAARPSRLHT